MRSFLLLTLVVPALASAEPVSVSGIYPELAMFNQENECGTGAVVPWADRLWVITYAPHKPKGSSDKLYEITPALKQIIRPESIGGTPANRMIHRESKQLFIGPHAIDASGNVRTIPYSEMFGRPTGNARHLADPAGRILYATMEEGIYEVDVKSLQVKELWGDEASRDSPRKADLPGYHGKGFYSGQGVYVYSNNGEHGKAARTRPDVPSGVLAEWDGRADAWIIVRRNQFTEITGPGGITGNPNPATDPIWAVGWDAKSLLMGVRDPEDGWSFRRLPKGSHSYDGAHGWNTEWPRIRDIGEDQLLMTMHGTFWRFPKDYGVSNFAGIAPRSNYLKVIGDFCRWQDRIVFGCDDTAANEFLNKRSAKGEIAAPQSQSNLWFVESGMLDRIGPVIGRGAVWDREGVRAGQASDAYLFSGYDHRYLHLHHDSTSPVSFRLEVDPTGSGSWTTLREIEVGPRGYAGIAFSEADRGEWIRILASADCRASAVFSYRNRDERNGSASAIFDGLASSRTMSGGLIRARGGNVGTLVMAATRPDGSHACYELDARLRLVPSDEDGLLEHTRKNATIPNGVLGIDEASVVYVDDSGKRWRLPKGSPAMDQYPLGDYRVCREVATERDFFNAHGSFYELPAENAGGFSKVRAVATHNRYIQDFCSYRGLFVISGIDDDAPGDNPHIIRSSDGKAALWVGAIDDAWKIGKPVGEGGPWKDTRVRKGDRSDPYLMTGYDRKTLHLTTDKPACITAEIDLTGSGRWVTYDEFEVDGSMTHEFPEAFQAYWIRFTADRDITASAQLEYR